MILFIYTVTHSYSTDVVAIRAASREQADDIIARNHAGTWVYQTQFDANNITIQNLYTVDYFGT